MSITVLCTYCLTRQSVWKKKIVMHLRSSKSGALERCPGGGKDI